jgi:hypothetical protein
MKKQSFALLALALAFATSPAARADSFNFTFSDGAVSGSGTLTGTFEGSGFWQLTGGSGTFDDGTSSGAITLQSDPGYPVAALDPYNAFGYDDQLQLWNGPNQFIDGDGLFFTFGALDLNLWQPGGGPGYDGWAEADSSFDPLFNNYVGGDSNGTFVITAYEIPPSETPEPGSYLLLGTGLCALAGLLLHKRLTPGLSLKL